jgi:hypothetical protein
VLAGGIGPTLKVLRMDHNQLGDAGCGALTRGLAAGAYAHSHISST